MQEIQAESMLFLPREDVHREMCTLVLLSEMGKGLNVCYNNV